MKKWLKFTMCMISITVFFGCGVKQVTPLFEAPDLSMKLKDFLATYNEAKDLINIGAYAKGSNPKWDIAIEKIDRINEFLKQGIMETVSMGESLNMLKEIMET